VTLKVRLAAMMIVLLGAMMAAQYLLLQREQHVLAARLATLTEQIDASTRLLTERTRARFPGPGFSGSPGDTIFSFDSTAVVVVMHGDSTSVVAPGEPLPPGAAALRHWSSRSRGGTGLPPELDAELEQLAGLTLTEERIVVSEVGDTVHLTTEAFVRQAGDSSTIRFLFVGPGGAHAGDSVAGALRVNVPFLSDEGGPRHVELLYSTEGITAELDRARRRSYFWLTALLGVGATAAVAVAVQFTSPIRSLQDSFRQVQEGDLNVALRPERPDEIGKLTGSFNAMVVRLRESRDIEHRLAESERLAAVGTLAAGVAHEVRNPLNAILLTLEQLRAKTAPEPGTDERKRFDQYIESVTGELRRLDRMVSTFLDLSRAGQLGRERVNVADSVRRSVELFADEARDRGVALSAVAPDEAPILGDGERLRTVWNNLITNALQAMPRGGSATVRVREEAGRVVVEVADEGDGIAPEVLGKIWEPFYSGRPDGTGLGLALVRSIVEKHGGTIDVESAPGRGATFRVSLPSGGEA
jgi:signal transduction histidine kinase